MVPGTVLSPVPLFGPVPGGLELVVIFFVVLVLGPVVAAVYAAVRYSDRAEEDNADERIAELETRVAELEGGADANAEAPEENDADEPRPGVDESATGVDRAEDVADRSTDDADDAPDAVDDRRS